MKKVVQRHIQQSERSLKFVLQAHIVRPPFVPLKCRELLTDYILLAKTRLADLKQPLDGALEEDQDIESRKKMNEQIEDDIQKAVVLYQSSKKIPSSIMEASIFRKPYYVGQFAENETNEINFREIPSHVLQKVCMYFTYKVRYTNSSTEIPEFPIAPEIALELLMAANFLDC
uniref:Elongin-C n=1 Tax=Magallana gigas TaxID=29159 RepID=K1QZ08_MAGGI